MEFCASNGIPILTDLKKRRLKYEGADDLYREIRITNTLLNEDGEQVVLKPGAEVQVTVEAPAQAVVEKEKEQQSPF